MKTLYLIRHATAEDGSSSSMFRDFDRDLISSGIIEAARMANYMSSKSYNIDLIVSSKANRAFGTAKIMAEQWKMDVDEIQLDDNLYGGGPRAYLAALNQLDESVNSVVMVGHNPDISFFGEYLTRDDTGGQMKKAGVLILTFTDLKWAEISNKSGSVKAYHDPKNILEENEVND
ncbi:MAG: histidine phosphatase family protein [Spirosomaceae bacterium]|nr:histidine phosphatase family protein [Spirosomataceae bacterium]